jgi:hypothetical protein
VIFASTALTIATLPTGCGTAIRVATKEAKPFSYVGNVTFGEAEVGSLHVVVPVKYSGGDWSKNSGIVPYRIDSTLKDKEIEITVHTSVPTGNHENGYRVILPATVRGEYTVYYRDPDGSRHEIGPLEIGIAR